MITQTRFTGARRVTVLEVCTLEGNGVDHDPARRVTHYVTDAGEVLAVVDSWREGELVRVARDLVNSKDPDEADLLRRELVGLVLNAHRTG